MRNAKETLRTVRDAIRSKYAWPGGYRLSLLMRDGATLCTDCGRKEYRQIARETLDKYGDTGWAAEGAFIHWEGDSLICAHCGTVIEPEYGTISE